MEEILFLSLKFDERITNNLVDQNLNLNQFYFRDYNNDYKSYNIARVLNFSIIPIIKIQT